MLNERLSAARLIADKLHAAEAAIDQALACAAELSAAMPVARMSAKVSALVGHEAISGAAETQAALVEARRRLIATHCVLDQARLAVGLQAVALGGGMVKPSATAEGVAAREEEPSSRAA